LRFRCHCKNFAAHLSSVLKYLRAYQLALTLLYQFLALLRPPNAASNTSGTGRSPRPCPPADDSAGASNTPQARGRKEAEKESSGFAHPYEHFVHGLGEQWTDDLV
jgi:hypothetical protein